MSKIKLPTLRSHRLAGLLISLLIILAGIASFFYFTSPAFAAWYNSSWTYRQTVTITNNGSLQSNYPVQVTLDTYNLVSQGKMLSTCADVRFTTTSNSLLNHYLETGCNTDKTVFWVQVDNLPVGTTLIYIYYGNSGASSTSSYINHASSVNLGSGADGDITISSNTNLNTADLNRSCNSASSGDAVIYTSTANTAATSTTIVLVETIPDPGGSNPCLIVGDEVLIINLQGTSGSNSDVGKYETARITDINTGTGTITLDHALVNGYDGTTQKIVVQRIPNYNNVTINASATLSASDWDGSSGGVLFFRTHETLTVNGTLSVSNLGYRGGAAGSAGANGGTNGESYDGTVGSGGSGSTAGTSGGGDSGGHNTTAPLAADRGGGGGGGSSGGTSSTNGGGGGGGGGYGFGGGGGGGNADGTSNTAGTGGTAASGNVNAGGGGGGRNSTNAAGANGGDAGSSGATATGAGGAAGSGTTGGAGGGGANNAGGSGGGGGGGGSYGSAALTKLYFGSGGGGGGNSVTGGTATVGGDGGGILYVSAGTLTIDPSTGTIVSDGEAVSTSATARAGRGGSGAGGSVYINANTVTLGTTRVTASGGTRRANASDVSGGGAGGDGRIHIDYSSASSFTTTPTADSSVLPVFSTLENEETESSSSNKLLAYWSFDEGYGTTAGDSSGRKNTGTLAGTTKPTWQSKNLCYKNRCLYFDGTTSYVSVSRNVPDIQTVSFWVKPTSVSSIALLDLNGSARITVSSGVISATGFTDPQIYIDGQLTPTNPTLQANRWTHIAVTTSTAISGSAIRLGNYSSSYLPGFLDEVSLFNYQLTSSQIQADRIGGSATFGLAPSLSTDLLGHWKLNETSGNAVDSSGRGLTLTNNGTTTYVNAKFSRGSEHIPTSTQYFSYATSIGNVSSVSFWTNPDSTTNYYINLSSTANIQSSSGAITANGLTNPKIYVNGILSNTITADTWQHVVVVSDTAVNADTFYLGRIGSNYYDGTLDDVRVFSSALSPSQVTSLLTVNVDPVAWYKFDENSGTTLNDSSGNGNTGTLNTLTSSTWSTGKFGSALNVSSSNAQSVTITDSSSLSITGDMTISVWIKPSVTTAATVFPIVAKAGSSTFSYGLALYGDEVRFYVGTDSTYVTTDSSNLVTGEWYHIEAVYNASAQSATIYLNGLPQAATTTGTLPSSITDNSDDMSLTGSNAGATLPTLTVPGGTSDASCQEGSDNSGRQTDCGLMYLSNTFLDPGAHNTNEEVISATRFSGVNIPQGASITSASYTLVSMFTSDSSPNVIQYYVSGEDVDNAGVYVNSVNNIGASNRPRTTAYYTWDQTSVVLNDTTNNIDITDVIQEIVDRPGWSSGNAISIIVEVHENTTNPQFWQEYYAYEDASSYTATLDITFGSPVSGYYDGAIDELKIYDYRRSDSQIVQDYNGGHPAPGSPVGSATAYWKFDEGYSTTAYNIGSAASTNLTLSSSTAWTNTGKFYKAFDGADNRRVTGTDNSNLEPAASESFSISAWFRSDGATTAATEYLVSKGGSGAGGYQMYFNTSGQLICGIDDDATSFPEDSVTSPADVYDTSWHHAVCIRDITTSRLLLYIDGILVSSSPTLSATGSMNTSSVFYLGDANATNGTDEFLGDIDEVKFYRLALTADQVKVEYNHSSSQALGTLSSSSSSIPTNTYASSSCIPGDSTSCSPPVAEWNFDANSGQTLYDISGNARNWDLGQNTSVSTDDPSWSLGKFGGGLKFDGSTDCLSLGSDTADFIPASTAFTISGWIKPVSFASEMEIFESSTHYDFYTLTTGGIAVYSYVGAGDVQAQSLDGVLTTNQWNHIAFVYNDSNSWTFYVNGVNVTSDGTANEDSSRDNIYNFGAIDCDFSPFGFFNGSADQFKIYHYARSQAQIAWDYNQGAPVAHYKLDECSGTTAYNSSLNGNGQASGNNLTIFPVSSGNTSVGTCTGSANQMWYHGATGKFASSLDFDGGDDYAASSNTVFIRPNSATYNQVSWGGWFRPATSPTSDTLIHKGNEFRLTTNASGFPQCEIYSGGSWQASAPTATSALATSTWSHVMCTYDGSTLRLYINGSLVKQAAQTNSITSSSSTALSLARDSAGSGYFDGQIDDVRIYNYPLTLDLIRTVVNEASSVRFGP